MQAGKYVDDDNPNDTPQHYVITYTDENDRQYKQYESLTSGTSFTNLVEL